MATEGRRPLHQRSNSQLNAASNSAGIKQTEGVSNQLASTPSLFHNSSKLLQILHTQASLDTLGQTKQSPQDENALSRRTSVASKNTAKTSRSSSVEKRINLVTIPVSKATSRSSSNKSTDRIPSGPPPYSGPPQGTSTIRFVPRSPAGTPPHKHQHQPSASSSTTRKVASKKRSVSTLSSDHSSEFNVNLLGFDFAFSPTEFIPSPAYSAESKDKKEKESVSLPRKHSFPGSESSAVAASSVNNTTAKSHTQASPSPTTGPGEESSQAAIYRSTIRYVAPTPPGGTPVVRRVRSRSNPRTVSTRSRSSTNTSNTSSISRKRSRSSEYQYRRPRRPSVPSSSAPSSSRVPSRHSTSSYFSSISAIGFPPSRPLPTPPDRPGTSASQAVSDRPVSPVALPKLPRPILKKARTSPELFPVDADATPPIDAEQYPEIRPALSWILETAPAEFAPAPLNITKPKRARMQVLPDEETTRTNNSNDRSHSHGSESVGLNGSSEASGGSGVAATTPSVNVKNVRGYNPHYWQADGAQSERATVFSVGDSHYELRRGSTNPAYFTSATVPEWARVYYGSGHPLPNHQEEADAISENDDLRIESVAQPRRPPQAHLQRLNTNLSRAGSVWMGTRNPEGRDLQDQFTQPHLENTPINRSERLNTQLILFCVGFLCPLTWLVAAFLPLPSRQRWERRERLQMQQIIQATRIQAQGLGISHSITGPTANIIHTDVSTDTESLPSITTCEENRRYDNVRWWRNVNRIMVVIGILLGGGIIALLVVGLKHKSG